MDANAALLLSLAIEATKATLAYQAAIAKAAAEGRQVSDAEAAEAIAAAQLSVDKLAAAA